MRWSHAAAWLIFLTGVTASAITTYLPFPDGSDPLYTSAYHSLYGTTAGDWFEGVTRLTISIPAVGGFLCTGSLIGDRHVLTAAHCVTDRAGVFVPGTTVTAAFDLGGSVGSSNITIHPDWDPVNLGADLAIIELAFSAPLTAQRYDLYRDRDELGQIGTIVGYGRGGDGNRGEIPGTSGTKRVGLNRIDNFIAPDLSRVGPHETVLLFDFDNGTANQNALVFLGLPSPDEGDVPELTGAQGREVNTARGDSGGPTFLQGRVAGVTSWGVGFQGNPPDVTPGRTDSSFGELFGNTRVSSFAAWIDSVTGRLEPVPEPSTFALLVGGLTLLAWRRRQV